MKADKAHAEVIDGEKNLFGTVTDKVEEYFKLKGVAKTLNEEFKTLMSESGYAEEIRKLKQKILQLKQKVEEDVDIVDLKHRREYNKERIQLLKELIRIEMLETSKSEVKRHGRMLKLQNIIKDTKDLDAKSKSKSVFKALPGQINFS